MSATSTYVFPFSIRKSLISLHSDHLEAQRAIRGIGGGDLQRQIYQDHGNDSIKDTLFKFDGEETESKPETAGKYPNGYQNSFIPREPSRKNIFMSLDDETYGSSDDEGEKMTLIANSKLTSLLSSLDPKADLPKRKTEPFLSCSVPASAAYLDPSEGKADFMFLKGTMENSDEDNAEPKLHRSVSAPCLGDEKGFDIRLEHFEELERSLRKNLKIDLVVEDEPSDENFDQQLQLQEDQTSAKKYKRSSSLKSGKTPPSSPKTKKIVQFADLWGQELTSIRTFVQGPPNIPKCAYADLDINISDIESDSGSEAGATSNGCQKSPKASSSGTRKASEPSESRLQPLFTQPSGTPTMFKNLREKKVSLETAYVCKRTNVINGVARVANIAYDKRVVVRYTTNDWASHSEVCATYLGNTNDGFADRFSFVIDAKEVIGIVGARLQLCVNFQCLGNNYWDNNCDANYVFQYFAGYSKSNKIDIPVSGEMTGWRKSVPSSSFSLMSHSPSATDDPWSHLL